MGKHRFGRRVTVGKYQRKGGKQRAALDIVARLVNERNAVRIIRGEWLEPFPTRQTVTRHRVVTRIYGESR